MASPPRFQSAWKWLEPLSCPETLLIQISACLPLGGEARGEYFQSVLGAEQSLFELGLTATRAALSQPQALVKTLCFK